jgi:hypothetical protein
MTQLLHTAPARSNHGGLEHPDIVYEIEKHLYSTAEQKASTNGTN